MTPTTVFDTYGIVTGVTSGHVPASYILTLIAIMFTAVSYGNMVRAFPGSGSAYTYCRNAINPHVGFMVGRIALLDYIFLPMAVLITTVNIWSNNMVANMNSILAFFQIAVVVIFIILVLKRILYGG